jgi:hypothetical protein
MRFYYVSPISLMLLGVIYLVGTGLLLWFWAWLRKRMKKAWIVMAPLFALLFIGPVAEEFWIAWNFGQLCKKDAGIFVYKTVAVEGFYDSTMRSAYENTKPGRYRFVEHPTEDRKGVERVERVGESVRNEALAWYARTNPGKDRPKERSIFYPLNNKETIAVFPNGIDAWRITKLEHPMARYHYTSDIYGERAAHKITRQESQVIDREANEVIGRYVAYGRRSPWFYIGLGEPPYSCDGPEGGPNSKYNRLIYREVLPAIK